MGEEMIHSCRGKLTVGDKVRSEVYGIGEVEKIDHYRGRYFLVIMTFDHTHLGQLRKKVIADVGKVTVGRWKRRLAWVLGWALFCVRYHVD